MVAKMHFSSEKLSEKPGLHSSRTNINASHGSSLQERDILDLQYEKFFDLLEMKGALDQRNIVLKNIYQKMP